MVMGRFWSFSFQLYLNSLTALTILYYAHYFFHGVPFGKLLHHRHPQLFFCNMVIKGFKWHPIQKMASFCHPHLRNICPINWVSSRIAASMNGHFFRAQQAAVVYQHCCDLQRFYSVTTVLMFWTIIYGSLQLWQNYNIFGRFKFFMIWEF